MSTPTARAWEPEFVALWTQGLESVEIAEHLGIPKGTVQRRAHRLQQRGLIQPWPMGGAYPSQRVLAWHDGSPTPGQSININAVVIIKL